MWQRETLLHYLRMCWATTTPWTLNLSTWNTRVTFLGSRSPMKRAHFEGTCASPLQRTYAWRMCLPSAHGRRMHSQPRRVTKRCNCWHLYMSTSAMAHPAFVPRLCRNRVTVRPCSLSPNYFIFIFIHFEHLLYVLLLTYFVWIIIHTCR